MPQIYEKYKCKAFSYETSAWFFISLPLLAINRLNARQSPRLTHATIMSRKKNEKIKKSKSSKHTHTHIKDLVKK
jgi:hypothetical protein